ncbi:MAG: hypothetical protein ACR2L1_04710 [Pyrinomonadaceae bacterium]
MKLQLLILILLLSGARIFAQTVKEQPPKLAQTAVGAPCSLKSAELAAVRGLRLEMTKAQVQKEFPLMKVTADPVKSSGVILGYQISNPEYRDNIFRITIMFRNDRVFSILLNYSDGVIWDSQEEFAGKISESLNLPKARKKTNAGGAFYAVICNDFMVRTRINGEDQPILLITKDPDEIWETSQQKKEIFKP